MQSSYSESTTASEHALRQTQEFREHVARLFTPLKPGLAYVRTMEYATDDFEADFAEPDFMDVLTPSPALLHRARLDAIRCVDHLEAEFIEQIESDAIEYQKNPDPINYAWNATNPEDMQTVLCEFCDVNVRIWEEDHHPTYHASLASDPSLTDTEREALSEYVKSFVGSACVAIPYHLTEGDEEIYYDSADTEEAMDREPWFGLAVP